MMSCYSPTSGTTTGNIPNEIILRAPNKECGPVMIRLSYQLFTIPNHIIRLRT
jgi:hypothetical protein